MRALEEVREWDSHALDAQRFYNLACLAYGSDPRQLEWIIQATGLPEQRAFYCDQEYQQVLHAVHQYVRHASQLPRPWLGIGQSTGGAIWLHHLLEFAERREDPYVERVLLLSPLIRPAKSAWWHNSVGLGIIRRIKREVPRHFRRNNHNPEFLRFIRLKDPLQPRMMGMDWILAMSKWMQEMEQRPACRIPVWLAQGAQDQTVDWRYNIEFIRRKFRLQTLLMLEEGSHQLINERADIRAALTGLIPAFLHAQGGKGYY